MKAANIYRTVLVLVACAALMFSLAACGGGPAPETTEAPTQETQSLSETPEDKPILDVSALGLDTVGRYDYSCEFVKEPQPDLPRFTLKGAETAAYTAYVEIGFGDVGSNDVFSFVLQTALSAPLKEEQTIYSFSLVSARNNRFFFYFSPDAATPNTYLIYDAAQQTLNNLGTAQEMRFLGKTLLLRRVYPDSEMLSDVSFYNPDGVLLYTFGNVYDMELNNDVFYMAVGEGDAALYSMPLETFFADMPDFNARQIAAFPGYTARFGYQLFGRVVLETSDFSDLRVFPVEDAEETARALENAPARTRFTESCKAFSITLPGMFRDLCTFEKTDDSIRVYLKDAKEKDGSGLLFGYELIKPENAEVDESGNTAVYYRWLKGNEERYVVFIAAGPQPEDEYVDAFVSLLRARDEVNDTFAPGAGALLRRFDYSELVGRVFRGETDNGAYALTIQETADYLIKAVLDYTPKSGDKKHADVKIAMLKTGYVTVRNENDRLITGSLLPEGDGYRLLLLANDGTWLDLNCVLAADTASAGADKKN